ncbi:M48 family metallopeptidase [Desulfobacter latus]|uniref:M48 family metallopeptidase n=1 Tax=Desulfobacter latus TaxID=2292 RepID=A0A850TEF2_9BACT|nr:SprT family zinc-dependent metalloprotease [Desulfobacter latus]NWH06667.1 M48 family metallopeptidase [Desulfobacter latus]
MNVRRINDIDYILLPGTKRKTTDIVIERDGVVTVRPPEGFTPEKVDAVVHSKRMWIYKNLAEWRDLNAAAVVREWVNGESFLYLGRSYRLSLVTDQSEDLKLNQGRFCLKRSLIDKGGENAAKTAFERFYKTKGEKRIKDRIAYYAPKAGVASSGLKVKDMGYRWASCTKSNLLQFHWKCMMAPPKIIDYMVVHELCHIHHRNHTDLFWNEVDKVMPDYRERKQWLKKYGAGLDL